MSTDRPSRFAAALAGKRPFRPFKIPGLDIECEMTILGHSSIVLVESETFAVMKERKLDPGILTQHLFDFERAARTMHLACVETEARRREGTLVPVATVEEWRELPPEWMVECEAAYQAIRQEIDPLNTDAPLTMSDYQHIKGLVGKKKYRALRACGADTLTRYLLTTEDPPSS